jgi:2-alkenal reductase
MALLLDGDAATEEDAARAFEAVTVEQTAAISQAAAAARPSVIRIESTRRTAGGGTEQDIGSGVVLDGEGHIVTNAHVVLNTDELKVVLPDGTERPAILVGHDYPFTDVAVLQIGPGSLKPIEPGDSEALKLGETVVVVGNPLAEFDGSISVGVVSGLSRVRTLDGVRQSDLIQTDAAVNSGNSGGALVNLSGQFVGMPTAIIRQSRSGQAVEGIAFALPASRVLAVARTIVESGAQYPRPSLQAEHVDLTPEVLARISRPGAKEGALISAVAPGGAAAIAGILPGDIISRVGDHDVNAENPLFNVLMGFKAGDSAKVVLNRNGRIIETEVRFAQRS